MLLHRALQRLDLPNLLHTRLLLSARSLVVTMQDAHADEHDVHEAKRPRLEFLTAQPAPAISQEIAASRRRADISIEDERVRKILETDDQIMSTARVPFQKGLFLAPMVRIGSLPTRLLSLQYGADLVWSPEIVDRAIIGSERVIDERTGMVSFLREGKQILTTHPIERDRLIFQLGSASPEWAYQAIKHVTSHDDVAGVDLNCGCPKPFSTIGGMGAQLLSTPDLLCSILRAMRKAAPPHIAVSCKIRLLPTKEATQSLVRQIIRTNAIDALTVHCRTKDMRPREKALTSRFEEVRQVVEEETGGKLPLICNGDAWDAREAVKMMQMTGTEAIMIARGAEGNPSCFRPEGVVSVAEEIAPSWIRLALTFDNNYGNTKYCVNSLAFKPSSSIVPNAKPLPNKGGMNKQKLAEIRLRLSQAKSVAEMSEAFGVDVEKQKAVPVEDVLKDIREAMLKRYEIDGSRRYDTKQMEPYINSDGHANDSGNELIDIDQREMGINVV